MGYEHKTCLLLSRWISWKGNSSQEKTICSCLELVHFDSLKWPFDLFLCHTEEPKNALFACMALAGTHIFKNSRRLAETTVPQSENCHTLCCLPFICLFEVNLWCLKSSQQENSTWLWTDQMKHFMKMEGKSCFWCCFQTIFHVLQEAARGWSRIKHSSSVPGILSAQQIHNAAYLCHVFLSPYTFLFFLVMKVFSRESTCPWAIHSGLSFWPRVSFPALCVTCFLSSWQRTINVFLPLSCCKEQKMSAELVPETRKVHGWLSRDAQKTGKVSVLPN